MFKLYTGRTLLIRRVGHSRSAYMAKTVIIVEDNELNMKLFNDLLEAHGYKTLQTKDGRQALELAQRHHPDLIIMDIQLPEVSGLEVTRWIKSDDAIKDIPIIAVTAFAMKGDEEKIREAAARPTSRNRFPSPTSCIPSRPS